MVKWKQDSSFYFIQIFNILTADNFLRTNPHRFMKLCNLVSGFLFCHWILQIWSKYVAQVVIKFRGEGAVFVLKF